MKHQIIIAGLAVAVGCQEPGIAPGGSVAGRNPLEHVGTCNLNTSQTTSGYYGAPTNWGCGAQISIWDPSGLYTSQMDQARTAWNGDIFGSYGLPSFLGPQTSQPTGHYIKLVIDVSGGTSYFCGSSNGQSGDGAEMDIDGLATQTQTCPLGGGPSEEIVPASQLWELMMHEMGHAIGYSHLKTKPSDYNCVMSIGTNTPPGFVGTTCPEEEQLVYYNYSLRSTQPTVTADFTNPEVDLSPNSGSLNADGTLNVSATVTPSASLNWSTGGAASLVSSDNTGATIQNVGVGSSASLTATVVETSTILWPTEHATGNYTVVLQPPTNLSVGTTTTSSAPLTWTSGDALATTTVQTRLTASLNPVGWNTVGSAVAGTSSYTVSGLSSCAVYDVQVFHVRNGNTSTTDALSGGIATTTTGGVCAPQDMEEISCHFALHDFTHWYATFGWIENTAGGAKTYELAQNTTNNSGTATVVATGDVSSPSAQVGPLGTQSGVNYYFWVRNKTVSGTPSAWTPLAGWGYVIAANGCN